MGGWLGEINIKAKLSPAELKLGLSLAIKSRLLLYYGNLDHLHFNNILQNKDILDYANKVVLCH